MNDLTLGIRIVTDAQGARAEFALTAEQLKKLSAETGRAGAAATSAATASRQLQESARAQTTAVTGLKGAWVTVSAQLFAVQLASSMVSAALGNLQRQSIDIAASLATLSERTGVAVETLSLMRHAADQSDTSIQTVALGMRHLARGMADAQRGSGDMARLFRALGVEVADPLTGRLRAVDAVLMDVAETFSRLPEGPEQTALALQLFRNAGEQLIPMLSLGRAGLSRLSEEMARLGGRVTSEAAVAAKQYQDDLRALGVAVDATKMAIAQRFLPTLRDAASAMRGAAQEGGVLHTVLAGLRSLFASTFLPRDAFIPGVSGAEALPQLRGQLDNMRQTIERWENDLKRPRPGGPVMRALALGLDPSAELDRVKTEYQRLTDELNRITAQAANAAGKPTDENMLARLRAGEMLERYASPAERMRRELAELEDLKAVIKPEEFARLSQAIRERFAGKPGGEDMRAFTAALKQQVELFHATTETERVLYALRNRSWAQASPRLREEALSHARRLDALRAEQVAEQQRVALAESYGRQIEDQIAQREQLDELERNAVLSMRRQAQQLELQVSLIGLTNAERERALALHELEQQKVWLTAEAYEALRQRIHAAYDDKGVREARQKQLEDTRRDWERMQNDLQRGLTDSIFRGFEAGKPFGKVFFDSLKHMAATTVLRPVVEFAMAPWSRAIAQLLGSLGLPGLPAPQAAPAPAPAMAVPLNAAIAHAGGVPAYDALPTRALPAALFAAAPRLHAGIGPGERAAVLRADEAVLTPGQMRMLAPARGQSVRVELVNRGAPKTATEVTPRLDVQGMVVRVVLDDFSRNGPVAQAVGNTFNLRRA